MLLQWDKAKAVVQHIREHEHAGLKYESILVLNCTAGLHTFAKYDWVFCLQNSEALGP